MRELLPYIVNFSIVVALLVYLLRAPTRKYVYQRHEHMRDSFAVAAIAHKKAADRIAAARQATQGLAGEEAEILRQENAAAATDSAEIKVKAAAEAQRLLREAERMAGVGELEEATDRVRSQFLDQVVSETEENLQRGLKKDDHSAIIKRAHSSIEVGV